MRLQNRQQHDIFPESEIKGKHVIMEDPKFVRRGVFGLLATAGAVSAVLIMAGDGDNRPTSRPDTTTTSTPSTEQADTTTSTSGETTTSVEVLSPPVLQPVLPINYLRDPANPEAAWEIKVDLGNGVVAACQAYEMTASAFVGTDTEDRRVDVLVANVDTTIPLDASGQKVFPLNVSSDPTLLDATTPEVWAGLYDYLSKPEDYAGNVQPFTWLSGGITTPTVMVPSCRLERQS